MKLRIEAAGHGAWVLRASRARRGVWLVRVALAFPAGYLEAFCRFARPKDPAGPRTFLNTEFAPDPPGLRVGPWPGWRGIPELPKVTLAAGGRAWAGKFDFRGDERERGELDVFFECEEGLAEELMLRCPDARLRAVAASVEAVPAKRAAPRPVALRSDLMGVHPRLVIEADEIGPLRMELRGPKAPHWRRLRALLGAPWRRPFATTPEGKVLRGGERLTGADRTLVSAAVALLAPSPVNRTRARRTFFSYVRETQRPDFGPLGIDTQSGEVLYVLCIAYDWLHGELSQRERTRAEKRLSEIAAICRRHLDPSRRDYAQAHYLGCGLGLLAYAFLFWEEDERVAAWAAELRGAFDRVLAMLPADGFFPHGINLWVYEHGFLARWLELFRQCAGENLWRATPYFAAASRFRAAATSPDGRHGVTFGDPQYVVVGDAWYHLLAARRTGDAAAQAIGERLLSASPVDTDHRHAPPRRRVYELLWHDPRRGADEQGDDVAFFRDGGQVFIRRGDVLVTTRAGAPLGAGRRAAGEPGGYGHSDPCNGAVLVWRENDFVGSGPGPSYRRDSALHNIVTIGGRGQIGDGCVWFPDWLDGRFIPPIPRMEGSGDGRVRVWLHLERAYLPHLGVRRYRREMEIARDGALSGSDVVELAESAAVTWNWHTWTRVAARRDAFELRGRDTRARLTVSATPGADEVSVKAERFVAAYPHDGRCGTHIAVTAVGRRVIFRWALSWINR